MKLSLSSQNVIQYLQEAGLSSSEDGATADADLPHSSSRKNFSILVTKNGDRKLLVKQELAQEFNGIPREFYNEWLFHQLLESFPVLGNIKALSPLVVHYDEENSILVRNYLGEYQGLASYYRHNLYFPPELANSIGDTLASLHRATFKRQKCRDHMATAPAGQIRYQYFNPAQGVDFLEPSIFGKVSSSGLSFYSSYQSSDFLESAIADLASTWDPCCLTHNDLKLENVLVHSRWQHLDNVDVKMIDWESCGWGDPAYDLGTLLAGYLKIWLESLVVDSTLELEESLELAAIGLEILQPSMLALTESYLKAFPMILDYRKDFIQSVIKYAGLGLINQIQDKINNQQNLHQTSLIALNFAKNILTRTPEYVVDIFGKSELQILKPFVKTAKVSVAQKENNLIPLFYEKTRLRGC
ncbi:MAG: aminoglycoside phosphotransferase family protein [Cyanobacteria bacterium J06633_8]